MFYIQISAIWMLTDNAITKEVDHMAHDIFVSYSKSDKPIADALVAGLENKGIRCWIAPRDVTPGTSWGQAIIDAIDDSQVMVVILSGNSNQSRQVVREVERAVARDVIVIPFRVENVDPTGAMAYFLSSEHWLDAITPPLEKHIEKLANTIQIFLSDVERPAIEERIGAPEEQPAASPRRLWSMPTVAIPAGIGILAALCMVTLVSASLFIIPRITRDPIQAPASRTISAIAAEIYATEPITTVTEIPTTAPPPTAIEIPTTTPTPTATEKPTTTPTPTSVSDYPLPDGWLDHNLSSFSVGLPGGWEAVDVDKEGIEVILEVLTYIDSDWAQNTADMVTAEEMEEMLKFWAMDVDSTRTSYASVNIMYQSLPFPIRIADMCAEVPLFYSHMGIELLDTDCDLKINTLSAARFMVILHSTFGSDQQYQYLFMRGRNMWTMTLSVDDTEWTSYQPTFEKIAETFRESE
jgi:hypothetical protein